MWAYALVDRSLVEPSVDSRYARSMLFGRSWIRAGQTTLWFNRDPLAAEFSQKRISVLPERPQSVPLEAIWNEDYQEWELAALLRRR
jgi:hypothetical protein